MQILVYFINIYEYLWILAGIYKRKMIGRKYNDLRKCTIL